MVMNDDFVHELRHSYNTVGPLRPCIRTQFGLAAGNTRKLAVPEWPEKFVKVENKYEHLRIVAADNQHDEKSEEWWASIINEAANELLNLGVPRDKIVSKLENDFPLAKWKIYKYLSKEYKGRQGPKVEAEVKEEKKVSKRQPVSQSEVTKKTDTPYEVDLVRICNIGKIPVKTREYFIRENELRHDGTPKQYIPDLVIWDTIVVEAEGEGSASRDNKQRDEYFKKIGKTVIHIPNSMVKMEFADVLIDYFWTKYSLIKCLYS